MKLCYVLNKFPEVSETFVWRQVLDLLERGHDVDVIAARPGRGAAAQALLSTLGRRHGLEQRILYTGMPAHLVARALKALLLVLPAAIAAPRLLATAVDTRRFGWFAATGTLLTMGFPLAGTRRTYDAVIAHFGPQGVLAQGLREMDLLSGPLVTFFHAYDLTVAPRQAGRAIYGRLFEQGELQLAISERGARMLVELGAPPERVQVHHMGVDLSAFRAQENERRSGDRLRALSIGRLVAKKGFEDGIRAVSKARGLGLDVEYQIYGAGPLQATLERVIRKLNLTEIVKLCGAADQESLAAALRSCDVLLAPSITSANGDEEGIPVVIMEAMATEIPVIATTSGAVSELVEHEHQGFLVRERDSDAMAQILCRLAADRELRRRLGRAGRTKVKAEFEAKTQAHRLEQTLAALTTESSCFHIAATASTV